MNIAPDETKLEPLELGRCLKLLDSSGPIAQSLKGYEQRQEQVGMLADIVHAYNESKIALIEAGTGTGKSIAYLIPACLWALQNQSSTVISTNTIALQEQLLQKDIPFLTKTLRIDIKAVLVKGMNNYLCLRKLEESAYEKRLLDAEELEEFEKIELWAQKACEGSKSELSFVPRFSTWEKVGAESDSCNHLKCPRYKECFFFKARKEAEDAQLLIVNHHLLFADLSARAIVENYDDAIVLPPYQNVILDEAHHVEDVATEYFAQKVSRLGIIRQLSRLLVEKRGEPTGKLILVKQKIEECYPRKEYSEEMGALLLQIEVDLTAEKRNLLNQTNELFDGFSAFLEQLGAAGEENPGEKKLRLRQMHYTIPFWTGYIRSSALEFLRQCGNFIQALNSLNKKLDQLDELVAQKTMGLRTDLNGIVLQLQKQREAIEDFVFTEESRERVKWIELSPSKSFANIHLINARLEVAEILKESLFLKFRTLILCSATLTANQKFDYLKDRLGLQLLAGEKGIVERVYASPFDYPKQALMAVPSDMPDPVSGSFTHAACQKIWESVEICRGGVFVLFTSYTMLNSCYRQLKSKFDNGRFRVFRQGDDNRKALLDQFKITPRAVLFGTDSFWEGVDVVGDALRCVILVKIPFKVPSEPLIQARVEAIAQRGGNPFMDYTVPAAIVKFKQGFGRLIRNRKDRGCVVCLDPRLINKPYGKMFLNSLPDCQRCFEEGPLLKEKMSEFYRKTHYLAKSQVE